MIKKIEIDGLLSFENFELELRNLNVLIGPNGSGKSNLIEVLSLLQALPTDIRQPISRGGGIQAWLRQGRQADNPARIAVEVTSLHQALRYEVELQELDGRPQMSEHISSYAEGSKAGQWMRVHTSPEPSPQSMMHGYGSLSSSHSLSLFALSRDLMNILVYRPGVMGETAAPRHPQPADQLPDILTEEAGNLALIISRIINSGRERVINEAFAQFYPLFSHFTVSVFGNQVLLYMHEKGLKRPIPATRWSDGMIRYLCLLVVLSEPDLPALICIDEPDLGFHPDVMPHLARLIKEASEKTQVIITTHSRQLVDEFSDDPAAVLVCERDFDGATRTERLDAKRLEKWLKDYSLGRLWEKGEIGGNVY